MKRIAAAFGYATSWLALSPSLVPRTWWMTAIDVAVNAYGGQKLAEVAHTVTYAVRHRQFAPTHNWAEHYKVARSVPEQHFQRNTALLSLAVAGSAIALSRSMREQADIAKRTGRHSDPATEQIAGYIVGGLGWLALDAITLAANHVRMRVEHRIHTVMPYLPDLLITAGSLGFIAFSSRRLLSAMLYRIADQAVRSDFARPSVAARPTEPERSGSRYSRESFNTLGYHGRDFVASGPRKARIERVLARTSGKAFNAGAPAREPIRVFIGRLAHPTLDDAAAAAVTELERTGAFDREALLLVTNTGSGWIPQWSVCGFEYLHRGDCATAAIQYSFAGSWLAFLIHREQAIQASKHLLQAVEDHLHGREKRPKLYVTGESLGALGGNSAFYSFEDMRRRVDGALWTGTPRTTPIVDWLMKSRHYMSKEIHPLIGRGSHVRFVQRPKHLKESPLGEYRHWDGARIIYAQHASDPVVWWSPSIMFRCPDWLREPRGKDVSPAVQWYPWVSFWQLLADMPRSVQLPGGHGHSYHSEVIHYWNEIAALGYTKKDCNKIGDAVAEDMANKSSALAVVPGVVPSGVPNWRTRL